MGVSLSVSLGVNPPGSVTNIEVGLLQIDTEVGYGSILVGLVGGSIHRGQAKAIVGFIRSRAPRLDMGVSLSVSWAGQSTGVRQKPLSVSFEVDHRGWIWEYPCQSRGGV